GPLCLLDAPANQIKQRAHPLTITVSGNLDIATNCPEDLIHPVKPDGSVRIECDRANGESALKCDFTDEFEKMGLARPIVCVQQQSPAVAAHKTLLELIDFAIPSHREILNVVLRWDSHAQGFDDTLGFRSIHDYSSRRRSITSS